MAKSRTRPNAPKRGVKRISKLNKMYAHLNKDGKPITKVYPNPPKKKTEDEAEDKGEK